MRRMAFLFLFGAASLHAAGRWSFQSNPWVNLHQRLMYQAQFKDGTDPAGLDAEQLTRWKKAVDDYREFLAQRQPYVDQELIALDAALSSTNSDHLPASVPQRAAAVLSAAMPLYRAKQWDIDDRTNRFWISIAEPLIASAGEELAREHAKVYGVPFPSHLRVDVAAYAGQFGGYTVGEGDSGHTVMSSTDTGYQGFGALEMLLHEGSHVIVGGRHAVIGDDLTRLGKELNVRVPFNLWHAILFYTSSELTRRALASRGVTTAFTPSMTGMYTHGYAGYRHALETYWQAYLDGKMSRDDALRQILSELNPAPKS